MAVAFAAGFCLLGLQLGLNAISGLIYPTYIRSNGAGWAFSVSRLGAVVGPLLGGMLISMHVPIADLYLFAAIPPIIGACACFALTRLFDTRISGAA
jgi:AAHS family 4-hydroxybenzoate transporter-like MFS transporter